MPSGNNSDVAIGVGFGFALLFFTRYDRTSDLSGTSGVVVFRQIGTRTSSILHILRSFLMLSIGGMELQAGLEDLMGRIPGARRTAIGGAVDG